MSDTRIVYGARCTWWDSIDKAGKTESGPVTGHRLPACPFCGSVLFEYPNEAEWFQAAEKYAEKKPDPDYVDFIKWARGKCFPNFPLARKAFDAQQPVKG